MGQRIEKFKEKKNSLFSQGAVVGKTDNKQWKASEARNSQGGEIGGEYYKSTEEGLQHHPSHLPTPYQPYFITGYSQTMQPLLHVSMHVYFKE